MKLVDYLRALLSQFVSKNDTGFIVQQNSLKTNASSAFEVVDEGSFVSTVNGEATLSILVPTKATDFFTIKIGEVVLHQHVVSRDGYLAHMNIPVSKGERYSINTSVPTVLVRLFGKLGGGNLVHSLGGVLCLLSSSVHYLNHSSVARESGLPNKQLRQTQSLDTTQLSVIGKRLSLKKTAGFLLNLGQLIYLSSNLERIETGLKQVCQTRAVGNTFVFPCLFKKVFLKAINSREVCQSQSVESHSTRIVALSNLSYGGASC